MSSGQPKFESVSKYPEISEPAAHAKVFGTAVRLAAASRPHQPRTPDFINQWASWGAGTRAPQYLVLGAKARALLKNRAHVILEDLQTLAAPVLRHRILLNYRAEAEGVGVEKVILRLLDNLKSSVA